MPAAKINFHRLAAREYRSARDWYRKSSETVVSKFRDAVDRAIARIEKDADALPLLTQGYRYVRVARFPYIVVFRRREDDSVMVVAVAHTSRRPGYWRRRK
jgi:toxin ParE1/3/4